MEKIPSWFGFLMIFAGIILIANNSISKMTGNIIAQNSLTEISSFGFIFLILGIAFLLISHEGKLERNLAREIRESGRVIDKSKDLIHIAKKMGYTLGRYVKEGIEVYNGDKRIAIIPMHNLTSVTSRNILKDLAEGDSGHGKRNY